MKFRLSVTLGNDAMLTGADVARALRKAADRIEGHSEHDVRQEYRERAEHAVVDANGKSCGEWRVTK